MKNKIAIASAFVAASSFSMGEIVVNDFLSFEGFVDSSYSHTDAEAGSVNESDNSFQVDQVEISWLFDFDAVTAQIDLEYEDGDNGEEDGVEQAFVNYALGNGDVVTAGRYASMLGFEAYEPTGLYQYSTAYDIAGFDGALASEYNQGVKYTRTSDTTFFGISVQDEAFGDNGDEDGFGNNDADPDRLGGDGDSSYAVEVAGSMDLGNGFTVFAGAAFEDADLGDNQLINAYVTYETGAWLFAAEINVADYSDYDAGTEDLEVTSGLLMANYAYSDVASVTARISAIDAELGTDDVDITKYTLAHNYALSDNLLLVTEISYADGDLDLTDDGNSNSFDGDATTVAVELLFSF